MFGGAMIAGLAYVQYQAARKEAFYLDPCRIDVRLLTESDFQQKLEILQ
jgi:hypothetical protein